MLRTVPSFPPIETWAEMTEDEQDAVIQAIEISRRRRSRIVPTLATIALGTAIAFVCYFVL
jgi:hypothetical protein